MAVRVLRAHERSAMPWKNGGGVTREITAGPAQADLEDFTWRVSLADIDQSGAFSVFAGVDRVITVVDGPGMVLTVDGVSHTIAAPYTPFPFPGDASTHCRLSDGPIVNLNVMTRRTLATARVRVVRDGFSVRPQDGTLVLVIAVAGRTVIEESAVTLDRFDAALFSDRDFGTLRVDGVTAVVTVTAASGSPGL